MPDVCAITGFDSVFNNIILPIAAQAGLVTSIIIAASYMIGSAISNPKVTLWAKTEALQLFMSFGTVLMLTLIMSSFCSITVDEVAGFFGLTASPLNVYAAAQKYMADAALYSHNAMTVVRYHLESYAVLSALSEFKCDFSFGSISLGCLFGYSGTNLQPLGGYGAHQAALNLFFNSAVIAHFTALNFLFILLFVYKGFVLLFLPLGVFLRSMPYMRTFGALLMAVALSFLIIYPFILSIFYIMETKLLEPPANIDDFYDESRVAVSDASAAGKSIAVAAQGADSLKDTYFPNGDNPIGAMAFAAYAFVAAVFLPSAALLATIASTAYIAKLYGEEIDLSRITQMV